MGDTRLSYPGPRYLSNCFSHRLYTYVPVLRPTVESMRFFHNFTMGKFLRVPRGRKTLISASFSLAIRPKEVVATMMDMRRYLLKTVHFHQVVRQLLFNIDICNLRSSSPIFPNDTVTWFSIFRHVFSNLPYSDEF
jgi:hypothetical protein